MGRRAEVALYRGYATEKSHQYVRIVRSGRGVIGGVDTAPPPPARPSVEGEESAEDSEVAEALSNAEAEAEGTAVGELFEYNLKERITVLKISVRAGAHRAGADRSRKNNTGHG